MAIVTLTLDGRAVAADGEQSLLVAARAAGSTVHTLCHFEGLSSPGACRLCLMEVEGAGRPVAACVTRPVEGMVVRTDSPALLHHRRAVLGLLLSERSHVCPVCVARGHCELQDLAACHGIDHRSHPAQHLGGPVDASHPRFVLDPARCVLCTRCVRACSEVEGAHVFAVAGRGASTRLVVDLDSSWGQSETCTHCGKCVAVCPTGALWERGGSGAARQAAKEKLQNLMKRRSR